MNLDDSLVQIQAMQQRVAQMLSTVRATPSQQQQLESIATSFQELCTAKVEPQVINEKLNSSSSDRFQLFATALDCIIYDWDIENGTVDRTQGLFDVLGYHSEEVEPTVSWWTQRIHSGDRERVRNAVKDALTNSRKFDTEYRVLHKDERYRYVRDKGLIVRNAEGKVVCVLGITLDITERKQVEEALKETTQRLQAAITNAPIILFALDSEGVFTLSEGRALESLGKKPNQSVGQSVFDLYGDNPNILDNMRRTLAGVEGTWIGEVGDLVYENRTTPLRDENGQVIGLIGVATDITERKRAQEALRESEQRLQAILDNSPIAVYIKDRQGRYLLVNRQCERIQRRSKEQIIGRTDYDAFPRAIADQYTANDREVLATQTPLVREEEMQLEDGLHTVISVKFPLFDTKGVPYAVCGISTDITERKRAEQALQRLNEELENRVRQRTESLQQQGRQLQNEIAERQQTLNTLRLSEELFRQLAENIHQVFWVKTPDQSQILYISPAYEQIWGRTCASLYEQPKSWMDTIHPDDRNRTTTILSNRSREARQGEYRIVRPDGSIRWIQFQTFPVRDEAGQVYRFVGIAEDISDRKQAEEALRRREQEFKALVENAPDVIARFDRQLRYVYLNPAFEQATGISPEACIGKTFQELGMPSELALFWSQEISRVFETGSKQEIEFDFLTPSGLKHYQSHLVPEFSVDGSVESVLGISRDITKLKQAEEALRRREQEFRALVENAPDVIARLDRQLRHVYVNPAIEKETGISPEAYIGKTFQELGMPSELATFWSQQISRVFETGSEQEIEFSYPKPNGLRYHLSRLVPEFSVDGSIETVLTIGRDITRLKQADEALNRREQEFRALVENAPDVIARFDRQLRHVYVNPAVESAGLSVQAMIGKNYQEIGIPEEIASFWSQAISTVFETGSEHEIEYDFLTPSGLKHYQSRLVPEFSVDGTLETVLAVIRDLTQLKQAEEALAESEKRFRTSVENMLDCFGIYSAIRDESGQIIDFRIEYVNAAACENNRMTKEQIIGKRLCELLPKHREIGLFEEYCQLVETGQPLIKEDLIYEDVSGEVRLNGVYDLRAVKLNDGFTATWRNITERKQAEDALIESEERFRQLAENINQVFWISSLDLGQILYISPAYQEIWGKSHEHLYENPMSYIDALHPEDRERVIAATERQAINGMDEEYRILRPDGSIRWIRDRAFPVKDSTGQVYRMAGIAEDITLAKQALLDLQESEQLFRQLTENIREVFWMTTPDHTEIIYVSPAYEEIWGRTCESLYEQQNSWLEAISSEDRERVIAAFETLWVGDYDVEYRIVRPDGTVRWIRDRGFPVRDKQGRAYRLARIAEDITQQKLIEAELEKGIQRERELNELRSRFISMTSHELRNPLTTIFTSAQLLERYRHKLSQENQLSYLHGIQAAVKQMIQLLDDVLLIGKAEAGRMKCNPTPIDLVQFCRDLVEQLQLADKNQHNVAFTHQGDCTKAAQGTSEGESREFDHPLLDEKLLRHILGNLLSNAIKYSPSGSTVRFDLTCLSDQAIFQIQDQGIGIPAEDLPRLFEAFHRANNVGKIKGTGLGLAIVKQCVDLQRGQISVESVVGSGTTFTVTLPLDYSEFISP